MTRLTPAIKTIYLSSFPIVILVTVIKMLARIRPKQMVMAEPMMGRKAKKPIQAPRPAMKRWARSRSFFLT